MLRVDPSECFRKERCYWQYGKSVKFLFILERYRVSYNDFPLIRDALSLSIAGPERTPCVAHA